MEVVWGEGGGGRGKQAYVTVTGGDHMRGREHMSVVVW